MTRQELNEDKQQIIFQEEKRKKRKKNIKKIVKFFFIIVIVLYIFFLYAENISTAKIIVNEKRIINEKIPNSFNGIKIIQFSDLHYGSNVNLDKVKEIVKLINYRNPDLVFFTGDLIDKNYKLESDEQEKLILELQNISASLGKYAVFGNEDLENYSTIMNQSNFTLLNNEYELIYNKTNEAILLTGFSSLLTKNINIDKALEYFSIETANSNIYSIGLLHEPDSVDSILNKKQLDLLLAGHSHNGNIRIPYIGSFIRTEGANKYNDSFYNINNSLLYISSGLGTQNGGIRLFCRPSINFFRLSNS